MTDKQELFVKEYLIDLNATQAALRAGYSKDTSYSIGSENLKKPEIQESIAKAQEKRSKRVLITADQVLKQIKDDRETAINLKQLGVAMKGNELLGKHLAMFIDKMAINHDISSAQAQIIIDGKIIDGKD